MKYIKFLKSRMYKTYRKGDKFPLIILYPSNLAIFDTGEKQDSLCFDPDGKSRLPDGTVFAEIIEE